MKILLTGADGFTGQHLEQAARVRGHDVIALRSPLQDPQALRDEVLATAPEAVVHLAAISFVGHGDAQAFYAVNTVGTTHLLDALCALPRAPRRVILASSANVYGNNPHSPIAEDATPAPLNHYAASKLAMEMMARNYQQRLPIAITRPFNYTGIGQGAQFVIPKIVEHFARRAPQVLLGNLHVLREYNPVQLVCDAYLHLLEQAEPGGTWNICSGVTWSLHDVIAQLHEITGHALKVEVDPALVRPNELHRLCGDPARLRQSFARHGTPWPLHDDDPARDLRATLLQMLHSAQLQAAA